MSVNRQQNIPINGWAFIWVVYDCFTNIKPVVKQFSLIILVVQGSSSHESEEKMVGRIHHQHVGDLC